MMQATQNGITVFFCDIDHQKRCRRRAGYGLCRASSNPNVGAIADGDGKPAGFRPHLAKSFAYCTSGLNPHYQAIPVVSMLDERGVLARHVAHRIMIQQARSLWLDDPVLQQRTSDEALWWLLYRSMVFLPRGNPVYSLWWLLKPFALIST